MNLEYKIIINNIEEVFDKFAIKNHIVVAVSGGSDSLALVMACNNYCKNHNIKLSALTIDHKVRINSSIEAKKLHNFLIKKNIDHHIIEINLADVPSANIEANLRDIRYKLLLEFCHKNNIEYLFLGHHLGDIAENFLIRLFRGSGLDGLSPIQELIEINQIKIIRPFLNINKNLLQQFLQSQQIQWFEDETNQDDKFLRNKIRNFLASFPSSELIEKRIVSASKEIALARDLIDELSIKYQEQIIEKINDKLYNINIKNLQATNTKIAQRILINFLTKISKKPYKPRKEKFLRFYQILVDNKITKKHEFNHCVIEKTSDGKIIIYSKD